MNINEGESYLIGLIIGKGFINKNSITIQFPYRREYVEGVALCPKCESVCTQPLPRDERRNGNFLRCTNDNCSNSRVTEIDPEIKKKYHQPSMFLLSIKNNIIPFLKRHLNFEYNLLSSNTCTFLTLKINSIQFCKLKKILDPITSFKNSFIPDNFYKTDICNKKELINGLLDSCGYANAGNRLMDGRQRVYFQIINQNYYLPISLDNFLRINFKIPIQTLRWAHPNVTDANLRNFLEGKSSSFSREHQLKIFIQYMNVFNFRIESKRKLLEEMFASTKHLKVEKNKNYLPKIKPIKFTDINPLHPEEHNNKINKLARGHFDAGWQISLKMGCKLLNKILLESPNRSLFEITGRIDNDENYQEIIRQYRKEADRKAKQIKDNYVPPKQNSSVNRPRTNPEQLTYPLLKTWLENYAENHYGKDTIVFDSSNQTLDSYIQNISNISSHLINNIELYKLHIRPDVVAFIPGIENFIFIESKVTKLGLKELGQLIGYCMVAQPEEAFLISTKGLSTSLMRILSIDKSILKYAKNKSIQIGMLDEDQVIIKNL